jgi:hypothetical protein
MEPVLLSLEWAEQRKQIVSAWAGGGEQREHVKRAGRGRRDADKTEQVIGSAAVHAGRCFSSSGGVSTSRSISYKEKRPIADFCSVKSPMSLNHDSTLNETSSFSELTGAAIQLLLII